MTLRIAQLLIGLVFYGAGCAVMVRAGIGLDPWTVFAQGLSLQTGVGIGWITNIVGFLVLLLWIPLRQRPGVGTVANILLVGTSMQATLAVVPPVSGFVWELLVFVGGMVMVAIASGLYIGARFGPGPRDGLMTGLHARFGWPIWACRLSVEATVLIAGWLLGGTVGIGTVLFAAAIGPLVHLALPLFDRRSGRRVPHRDTDAEPAAARHPSGADVLRRLEESVLAELRPVRSRRKVTVQGVLGDIHRGVGADALGRAGDRGGVSLVGLADRADDVAFGPIRDPERGRCGAHGEIPFVFTDATPPGACAPASGSDRHARRGAETIR